MSDGPFPVKAFLLSRHTFYACMEAFQAAVTVRPGSRLDPSFWVCGQAPASDKVRKVGWYKKEVIFPP